MNEKITYPIRLNRYLYLSGVCSRRMADRLIAEGQVLVNGKPAVLGQKITENDQVTLTTQAQRKTGRYFYFRYYKPVGVVSHNPQRDEIDAVTDAGLPKEFFPVGRLDKKSEGLMLLTNDGRIVNRLLNPEFAHPRTYEVSVDKRITDSALRRLAKGVTIEGYRTKPAVTERIDDTSFRITLTEGKKHQIRRMLAALGYVTRSLKRTQLLHLTLEGLTPGKRVALTPEEKEALLQTLKLPSADAEPGKETPSQT